MNNARLVVRPAAVAAARAVLQATGPVGAVPPVRAGHICSRPARRSAITLTFRAASGTRRSNCAPARCRTRSHRGVLRDFRCPNL